jgi:hypothetical protein
MPSKDLHLSDQEMLLAADGELSTRRTAQVHAHLAECWACRARAAEIESTIAEFARGHRQTLDPQLPPIAGPRALLRTQLAVLASERKSNSSWWLLHFPSAAHAAAVIVSAVLFAAVAGSILFHRSTLAGQNSIVATYERGSLPDRRLTPGVARRVTINDVCSMTREEAEEEVSTSLRRDVFQKYGIVNPRVSDYEIDYLIAPGLGGVEDIRNLWPEPYTSQVWNARVKNNLEEQLHQLVCAGKLDLSTAQSDIATDWIAAYKKYFHTDRPISLHSRLDLMPLPGFLGSNPGTDQMDSA